MLMRKYRIVNAMALIAVAAAGLLHAQTPQWQNLFPNYTGLAFGGGTFVAVSGDGVVKSSDNASEWSQQFGLTGGMQSYLSVGFGGGQFLVTQNSTGLLRSHNGRNWEVEPTSTNAPCRYLAYGDGVFVGIGDEARIFLHDGEDWSFRFAPNTTENLTRAAFGADRYVAVGSNIISASGTSGGTGWQAASISTPGGVGAVAFGNDMFVALALNGSVAYTSANGINWTGSPVSAAAGMADMTYGAGKFVAVGAGGRAVSSSDGTSWTASTLNESDNFVAVRYGNNMFVAVGARGSLYTSADGSSWTKRTAGRVMTYRQIISNGGSVFVAVGDSGVSVSSDGRDWNARAAGKRLQGVAYGGGKFIAVGDSGAIFSSADGQAWADHSLTGINRNTMLAAVAFGGNVFVAVGSTSPGQFGAPGIYVSSDGQNWAEELNQTGWPSTVHPTSIAFGNGKFVAGGSSNGLIKVSDASGTSPGRYWTDAPLTGASGHRIEHITYVDNKFIALGRSSGGVASIVLSSADGTSWTLMQNAPATAKSATFAKGYYVVAADSGNVYSSMNGAEWLPQKKATTRNLTTIFSDGNALIAGGVGGTMLYSFETPVSITHRPASPSQAYAGKPAMIMDNARKSPAVTLSFTPEKPGTIAVYSLTGKQVFKKRMGAGERSVQLPGRITSNGTVIVRYAGGDGRVVTQRFQMVR